MIAWLGLAHSRFRPRAKKKINNGGDIKKIVQPRKKVTANPPKELKCYNKKIDVYSVLNLFKMIVTRMMFL